MNFVVTGGGTGGHVYPALEVALLSRDAGSYPTYIGSNRGIEGAACASAGVPFRGLDSGPVGRPYTLAGIKSAIRLLRSIAAATDLLSNERPCAVFSTGGFAAAPVLSAAKRLKVPVVLHEQNSVPGRTHRIAARFAVKVCTVFEAAAQHFGGRVEQTGMPIRRELIEAATHGRRQPGYFLTIALGGSQGALALNEAVLTAALRLGAEDAPWIQVTGKTLYETAAKSAERHCAPSWFTVRAYLDGKGMSEALSSASIAVARGGAGTLSELALFGIPAIVVPYPHAHADHQYHNATAIAAIGGATVIRQSLLDTQSLEAAHNQWRHDAQRRDVAAHALRAWSKPDATASVWKVIQESINAPQK